MTTAVAAAIGLAAVVVMDDRLGRLVVAAMVILSVIGGLYAEGV